MLVTSSVTGQRSNVMWFVRLASCNKVIVDSRLRPHWCFHLANFIEMEEMLDCKLDAHGGIWVTSCVGGCFPSHISCLSNLWPWPWPWTHPGCTLTCSPSCASLVVICLREVIGQHELYTLCTLCTFVTNRLQYFAPASGRSNKMILLHTGLSRLCSC